MNATARAAPQGDPQDAAEPGYRIEVIVFARDLPEQDGERWAAPVGPDAGPGPAGTSPSIDLDHPPEGVRRLSDGEMDLNPAWQQLRAARGLRPLLHTGWYQSRAFSSDSRPIRIRAVTASGGEVEGRITARIDVYLNLSLDLSYRPPGGDARPTRDLPPLQTAAPVPAYHIDTRRRMRLDELHYFDHPRFGVLARVTRAQ